MTLSYLGRYALSISVAGAFLAGCGGSSNGSGAMPATIGADHLLTHAKTFAYTGARQWFRVPANVRKITVIAVGAAGGGPAGGFGGRVYAKLPVIPGERLAVFVGGTAHRTNGGYNGGGPGVAEYTASNNSYGGGGASDIRKNGTSLQDRILVAGGGGGAGGYAEDGLSGGGKGGGTTGGKGTVGYSQYTDTSSLDVGGQGGDGGSQTRGGAGGQGGNGSSGYYGSNGGDGSLGEGAFGGDDGFYGGAGGGGGGGSYGGGGGGGGGWLYPDYNGGGGGGGGGSSYIEPSAFAYQSWQGWRLKTRDGIVVFKW